MLFYCCCGLYFGFVYYSPCSLMFAFFSRGLCGHYKFRWYKFIWPVVIQNTFSLLFPFPFYFYNNRYPQCSCLSRLFLQIRSKPASRFQTLDLELKASLTSRTLGRGQRMRRQAPRVDKFSRYFTIGPNFFCTLPQNLRVICKP